MVKYLRYLGLALLVSILAFSYFHFSAKAAKTKKVLNLSKRGISDLSKFNFKEGLEKLYLTDNQISDLSGLRLPSTLKVLSLAGNQITSLEGLELNPGLERLNLVSNEINDLSLYIYKKGLKQSIFVNVLEKYYITFYVFFLQSHKHFLIN